MSAAEAAAAAARAARVAAARVQLVIERGRRRRLEDDIETLRQSGAGMEEIRQAVGTSLSAFRPASLREQGEWRGQSGDKYNTNRTQALMNTGLYQQEMEVVIGLVNSEKTNLTSQLTAVNNTIRNLEAIVNSGGW